MSRVRPRFLPIDRCRFLCRPLPTFLKKANLARVGGITADRNNSLPIFILGTLPEGERRGITVRGDRDKMLDTIRKSKENTTRKQQSHPRLVETQFKHLVRVRRKDPVIEDLNELSKAKQLKVVI